MRARFAGFAYFAGNAAYCVESAFERTSGDKTFQMATFDGKTLPFRRYGVFHFQLGGASRSLAAYQRLGPMPAERFAASRMASSAHRRAPSVASAFAAALAATSISDPNRVLSIVIVVMSEMPMNRSQVST